MSMTDPLADMITRVRNGQAAGKTEVYMPSSRLKVSVCEILRGEGYIEEFRVQGAGAKTELVVSLKYFKGQPVIANLQKISKPGRRVYRSRENLPSVLGGFGVAIISTPKGVMTDQQAREAGHGGEVLCMVS
jgi:small subunit ribosomal protein S8